MKKEILSLLKSNKVKITGERQEIINVLSRIELPLSPAELFLRIKPTLPNANLTTVYRNLELLEGLGVVKRLSFDKSSFRYELVSDRPHHHHVVCRICGRVEDIESESEKFVEQAANLTKFSIEDHNLEFFGLCKNCQKESK
jgi:Fe2+ or Zn2+ uptake regulation protein